MKVIGLLGGMSWESTIPYYRIINETVREELGGLHSARVLLYSVDFHEIEQLQHAGRWADAAAVLTDAARRVEHGGAELLVLCTNTMHIVADKLSTSLAIPLLHIADATADAILDTGVRKVGLLGTRFTMERDFYRRRLEARGLKVLVPDAPSREIVHSVIYDELCFGRFEQSSRAAFIKIIEQLAARGAEAVILGCTEIGLLVGEEDSPLPVFDTTAIHARAAARYALPLV